MVQFDESLLRELGRATHTIRKKVWQEVNEGVDIVYIIDFIENEIFSRGYLPAFPAMISINDMAAHYTVFDEGYKLQKGDVVKVDFGVSYNGFITDNAFTVEISSNNHSKLLEAAKLSLDKALETSSQGCTMNSIGESVETVAKEYGFSPIKNLTGHQLGVNVLHYGLATPNYANGDLKEISEDSEFAIEPFITYGEGYVKSIRPSNILHLVSSKAIRDPIAMKLLKVIKQQFPHLPFSKRWLLQEVLDTNLKGNTSFQGFDKRKVLYGVQALKKAGILYEYSELGTRDGSIVAQFEDTVLFINGEKIVLTRLGDEK